MYKLCHYTQIYSDILRFNLRTYSKPDSLGKFSSRNLRCHFGIIFPLRNITGEAVRSQNVPRLS